MGEFYSLMHSNDPLVFSHKSAAKQLCVPVVHSSTSENKGNNDQALDIFIHDSGMQLNQISKSRPKLNRGKEKADILMRGKINEDEDVIVYFQQIH